MSVLRYSRVSKDPRFWTLAYSSPLRRSLPQSLGLMNNSINCIQRRSIAQITVTNPVGARLVRLSKSLGRGIGLAYLIAGVIVAKLYFSLTSEADKEQPIPRKWPWSVRWLAQNGVTDEMNKRYPRAAKYFQDALLVLDKEYEDKKSISGYFDEKWLAGYADLNIRLGLVLDKLNRNEESVSYLAKGYGMNQGMRYLKSKAGVILGIKAYKLDHDELQAEKYLRTAVADSCAGDFPEVEYEALNSDGGIKFPSKVELNDEQIPPLVELAKFFAKVGRLEDAMTTLLSTYRGIAESKDPNKGPRGELICARALIMAHVSELLWAFGRPKEAVTWGEGSYNLSKNYSHTTTECGACAKLSSGLVARMYSHLDIPEAAKQFKEINETLVVPKINLSPAEARWAFFKK